MSGRIKSRNNKEYFYSIVIPCYNCEKTISECLDSILAQNYKNFEIIAVDDKSTDSTLKILKDFSKRDKRVKVVKLLTKGFAGGARNAGKSVAKGDVVVFLDSDVKINPDYLDT